MQVLDVLISQVGPTEVSFLVEKLGVNKTTVYRQLEKLVASKVVQEVEFGDGKKRYEMAKSHHHHLICNNCLSVTCFNLDQDLNKLESKIKKTSGFTVSNHALEFFGLCKICQ